MPINIFPSNIFLIYHLTPPPPLYLICCKIIFLAVPAVGPPKNL